MRYPLGTVAERKEFRQVQELMASGKCLNAGLYEEFKINNPTGVFWSLI